MLDAPVFLMSSAPRTRALDPTGLVPRKSVPVTTISESGKSVGFAGRGAVTTGGYVTSTWSSATSGGPGSTDPAAEVAVTDTDVKDVRVTVRRQTPQ